MARQALSEILAAGAVVLLAFAQLLATRARFLERCFDGLDKMYGAHRTAGEWGMVLLAGHVALVPWRLASPGGVPSGLLAFAGLGVLAALSLSRLRYGLWRRTHKLTGLFYAIGLAHILLVDSAARASPPLFALVVTVHAIGVAAYAYSTFLARAVRPVRAYQVVHRRRLDDQTIELALRPRRSRRISFAAGQFVFVRFHRGGLREPHPFTVSSAPADELLRLTIRQVGDFTRRLDSLKEGDRATVEGGYGRLDFRRGGSRQVWVAGGVGVTPFLSWLRSLTDPPEQQIDLFYTVSEPAEALYWEEIEAIASRYDNVRVHLHPTSQRGRLSAEHVAVPNSTVYLCGPAAMIDDLRLGLRQRGVKDVRREEFRFR